MRVCQFWSEPKLGVDAVEVVQVRFEYACFLCDVVGDVYWFGWGGCKKMEGVAKWMGCSSDPMANVR